MIDNIEIQVHKAEGYVEVAKEKTKETVEIHNDTRRVGETLLIKSPSLLSLILEKSLYMYYHHSDCRCSPVHYCFISRYSKENHRKMKKPNTHRISSL